MEIIEEWENFNSTLQNVNKQNSTLIWYTIAINPVPIQCAKHLGMTIESKLTYGGEHIKVTAQIQPYHFSAKT